MHIDDAAALSAKPSLSLASDEPLEANLFDSAEVVQHAHGIPSAVPLVQSSEPLARVFLTFIAEAGAV
jgi:hypothetical protein